jgi:ABC-type glycerol-3-phosphate transport system substrate-binding protein
MRRAVVALVAALLSALLVAACGGYGSGGGGGGGAAGGVPPPSVVWFGTAMDPATLSVTGKAESLGYGGPMVAVGHLLSQHPTSSIQVNVTSPGGSAQKFQVVAPNGAADSDVFGADLTSANLYPGTYTVNFVEGGRIYATATLRVT